MSTAIVLPASATAAKGRRVLAAATAALETLRQRRDDLADAIGEHEALVTGAMGWEQYDPDLYRTGGDPQENAVTVAEQKIADAMLAVTRTLEEYHVRCANDGAVVRR